MEEEKHLWEAHLFVGPVPAPQQVIDKFMAFCNSYETHGPFKGLRLKLCFDQPELGDAVVLQTSHYISDTAEKAKQRMMEVSKDLKAAGFDVLRHKLECASASDFDSKESYYELHVKLKSYADFKGSNPDVSFEEYIQKAKKLSLELRDKFKRPVPVSYNSVEPFQVFVNFRTRGVGKEATFKMVEDITTFINSHSSGFEVVKVIREYVPVGHDDNVDMDRGWIEYQI